MLKHEQKNVWKMIGMRIRRERIKRNWSSQVCVMGYVQYLIFPKLNRERWKYQKRF